MERFKNTFNQGKYLFNSLSPLKSINGFIVCCFIFLSTASIFFNTRVFIDQRYSYFLGEKKDFVINFFYLSDIVVIVAPLLLCRNRDDAGMRKKNLWMAIPWAIAAWATWSHLKNLSNLTIPTISIFYLLYISKWTVLHETIKHSKVNIQTYILRALWIFGLFQAFLAIIQFSRQASVGLRLLGESIFNPYMWGVAKVEALGQIFARPYGTFSHPNVLSAFLLLTLCLCLYYYYSQSPHTKKAWLYLLFVQFTIIALFISFSRAAWLATVIATSFFHVFTWNILKTEKITLLLRNFVVTAALCLLLLVTYQPFVKQRGNIFDKAYQERISYNRAAVNIIRKSPIFGLGPGETVLHMEQYLAPGTKPWEIQPIHNYYLLVAAELGVPALILFLVYVLYILKHLSLNMSLLTSKIRLKHALLISGLVGTLTLMFFDHYFYTIQGTMLTFWVWLGLAAAAVVDRQSRNDV